LPFHILKAMAYITACTTVQAVIGLPQYHTIPAVYLTQDHQLSEQDHIVPAVYLIAVHRPVHQLSDKKYCFLYFSFEHMSNFTRKLHLTTTNGITPENIF